jgi:hypothetical protein
MDSSNLAKIRLEVWPVKVIENYSADNYELINHQIPQIIIVSIHICNFDRRIPPPSLRENN